MSPAEVTRMPTRPPMKSSMPKASMKSSVTSVRQSIQKLVHEIAARKMEGGTGSGSDRVRPEKVRGLATTADRKEISGWQEIIGRKKITGREAWLAPAHPQDSTSNPHFCSQQETKLAVQRVQVSLPERRICSLELLLLCGVVLAALGFVQCSSRVGADRSHSTSGLAGDLSHEERHRLYTAALAASDSPLDTELFKATCRKIGIFDADGNPSGNYLTFVQEHIVWGMNPETNQFRSEINTKEKAQQYIATHLR